MLCVQIMKNVKQLQVCDVKDMLSYLGVVVK